MIETEKLLKYYILEYCSLIINHKTSLDSIPHEKEGTKLCLMKGFSFKFKKVESTMENLLNIDLGLGEDEPISYFHFKYDYMETKECSAPVRDPYNCTFSVHNKDGTVVDFAIAKGTWAYNFFKDIQKKLDTIGYLPHHYILENPLVSYCAIKQKELMEGNFSSFAITKENFEEFTSEFYKLINNSDPLKSLTRSETFKKTVTNDIVPITQNILISEDFTIKLDDATYPFELRYIYCRENGNISDIELYPHNFNSSSLKFTINATDKNFSLFMNIRGNLRKMSEKREYHLSDQSREPIKKNCDRFTDNLRSVLDKESKCLNITDDKSLNAITNYIITSNRTNGIIPHHLNSTNTSTPDLTYFNNITSANSLIATDVSKKPGLMHFSNNTSIISPTAKNSTKIQTSSWLIPLITAGGIISLIAIGVLAMFRWKRSRDIKDQSFDLKRKSSGTNQELLSFIPTTSVTVQADSATASSQKRTKVLENNRFTNINKKEFRIHKAIMQKEPITEKEEKATNLLRRTDIHRLAPLAEKEEFEDEYDGDIMLVMTAEDELITSTFISNTLPLSNLNGSSISIESSIPDSIYSKAEGTNLIGIRCGSSSTLLR